MNIRDIMSPARLCVVFVVALLANGAAAAADIPADSLKLAPGVAKAAGYETPATTYIVANSTNVYSGPSLVETKVTGQLNHGDHVDVLAKVKGWEWALIGKNGTGIGYVTISMLSPADVHAQATVPAQSTGPAQGTGPALELAFMPQTATVTLLNEGGKYVVVDLKHIPQGGTCRMDKDATIMRVGVGANPDTTRVRYAAAQISAGGCPFLTMFDMTNTDYAAGRAAYLKMEGDASKKVEQVKQVLGEKWQEIFGKKD
jgi:uncharacterized protein YgiM (DUF1202 family)